jgi:hypothetical protein
MLHWKVALMIYPYQDLPLGMASNCNAGLGKIRRGNILKLGANTEHQQTQEGRDLLVWGTESSKNMVLPKRQVVLRGQSHTKRVQADASSAIAYLYQRDELEK